ncbi:MAG: helix-turn-helix domain-containing protein [Verrucomicrobiales bacterium]|nr:helix-turn-helix domain-containing protein [Verrucomicrobiales bacterium]
MVPSVAPGVGGGGATGPGSGGMGGGAGDVARGGRERGGASGDMDVATLAQMLFRWARSQTEMRLLPTVERELVIEALKETQGNQVQAARLLGITRATLRKRIDKFGIRRELNVT